MKKIACWLMVAVAAVAILLAGEAKTSFVLEVCIDIKPGSCPNSLNIKSRGTFAVAVLGTRALDVTTIDPASIRIFAEDFLTGVGVPPLRWSFEDTAGGDGYLDLVFHFDTQATARGVTLTHHVGQTIALIIKGNILPAFDGTPIIGQDYVRILG